MGLLNTTTKSEFEAKVINSQKVVLVDFWAQWCPPCRAMAPILQQVGDQMDDKVDVVKIDIEASPENGQLAQEHGVQGIPNMQVYKDGKVVDQLVGMVPAGVLQDTLLKHA
ncbi:MAG TPA: thioredoxin [Candidatus Saccharibacteria bacterium]|jgi:thioredoxin 1|nr:thioredoxin [Candidatus Saccharibacteria bacterium]HMR38698.1 thioredoxin [Candidatus Saccharibacteria bacterium]